jgi:starvation-inducible DNA-binding protein
MATIRESLKKLAEVAKPVPGDEQEFVAKHGLKVMDFQGKDALSAESPYDHILKNVAAIKKPGDPGKDDHGHDAPGESEAAYHMPESRDEKIAKLSMMMEATIDPKEQQLADSLKSLLAETFSMYLKAHHFHWNVMGPDFAQYHDFLGELYKEVHGAVDMIAENIRVLGELAPGNLRTMESSQYTDPHLMVVDLMMDNEKVIESLKASYKLAESMDRLGISNFLQDRITVHEKHHWMLQAIAGVKGEEPMQEAKQVVGVEMHYKHPTKKPFKVTHFSVQDAERGRKEYEKMGYKLVGKKAQMGEEAEQVEEMAPLLPKQKVIAKDLLSKEMQKRKEERAAKKQAGVQGRPSTISAELEAMRSRHQRFKKQIIDKT